MEKIENAENDAKKSESTYSNSCSKTPSKRSFSSKSMHSGSNSSGSSGYGGKQSTSAYCYKDDKMKKSENTENNTKVSDSAYSNTYSNSQSRSYSSKSMHSGSNSSGSSGYGGKLSTSDYNQQPEKRNKDKEGKKKKQTPTESEVITDKNETKSSPTELEPIPETPKEYINNVVLSPPPVLEVEEKKPEVIEISTRKCSTTDEFPSSSSVVTAQNANYSSADYTACPFTCVVSMEDGIVMYATTSMTAALGYTKDMWMDRSFIEFVHPRDYKTFTSQIASGVAVPKNANATPPGNDISSMVCRIRQYKGLTTAAFKIKRKLISYIPYFLKFFFKNIDGEEGLVTYLVIQASPLSPAFKTSNELIISLKPFIIRHSASGIIQYLDPKSVPYLGYLPQDVEEKNALQLYHPSDLGYILQVYETIIRDGGKLRSKPYRMLAQNGYYLRLETEWSSFINPWSRKLEFVTCKHFILQGPMNPDVFQSFFNKNIERMPEDEEMKAQVLIKNIIRVMNEVPTKPANQQMSRKCHELALYMETLMDEIPNNNTNLTVEVTDVDKSFNEPDSVMLGGMSPHHDFSDSKSSSETPISYNQLNYNETLQRYFDNHDDSEENNTTAVSDKPDSGDTSSKSVSPEEKGVDKLVDKFYLDAKLLAVTNYNHVLSGYQNSWLTESMLKKHNLEMEKELVKTHRENRCINKSEKEKLLNELRQKKIDHLARCNNVFIHQGVDNMEPQNHGLKRTSIQIDEASAQKHRCSSERLMQQQTDTAVDILSPSGVPITMGQVCQFPSMDISDYINHEVQYKMDAISSQQLTQVPYQSQMPGMMFGRPAYGSPFMYSPMDPNVQYTLQQSFMSQIIPSTQALAIPNKNYEQACKMAFLPKTGKSFGNLARKRAKAVEKKKNEACDTSNTSIEASIPSKESSTENPNKRKLTPKNSLPSNPAEEESSYSSFYSSFFKTDSGSNEETDPKNVLKLWQQQSQGADGTTLPNPDPVIANKTMVPKRKALPPWLEHVHITSELIYKYQIAAKDLDEVLKDDREKLKTLEQPELVNEQLDQLYKELEKDGLPVKLNIEEGITSSSSSGEDVLIMDATKLRRRKREYSQLVMIYEEDAPLPPPDDDEEFNCKPT